MPLLCLTASTIQNRRQKVFSRGALQVCGEALRLCGRTWHYKINQNSTYLWCFKFQFGGSWSFAWGAKPAKDPVATRLVRYQQYVVIWCWKTQIIFVSEETTFALAV